MIQVEAQDGVDIVRLQHGKVNALDLELLQELQEVLKTTAGSANGAMVLTGSGSCFSAGVDLNRIIKDGAPYIKDFLPELSAALCVAFLFPKPLVAAINGHAIAGGCILAWACDNQIMTADAGQIGLTELAVGVPFPPIALEITRARVPQNYFNEIVLGASTYPSQAALAMGLVDSLVPPEDLLPNAIQHARSLVHPSPQAFSLTKQAMRQAAMLRAQESNAEVLKQIETFWQTPEAMLSIHNFALKTMRKTDA